MSHAKRDTEATPANADKRRMTSSNVAMGNLFIGCPNVACNKKVQVYHLHWLAYMCQKCDTIVHNPHYEMWEEE